MESPCKDCDRKGCGSYHDECKEYQEYKRWVDESKPKYMPKGRNFFSESLFRSRVRRRKKG